MNDNALPNLRQLAELRVIPRSADVSEMSAEDIRRLLCELDIHQEELAIQNEELRRSLLELEASRDRIASLFDFAPVGYLTLDSKDKIVAANLTAASMLGIERGHLVGRPFPSLCRREDVRVWHRHRKRLVDEGGRQACELQFAVANGADASVRIFEVQSEVAELTDTDATVLRIALIDITARKRAEAEARQGELKFKSLLDKLPAAAYTCDVDGNITYFNELASELWGREPKLFDQADRFCGSFKLFSADGLPISHDDCWMARTLREGTLSVGEEIIIERPDGTRRDALAHATPIHDESNHLIGAINVLVDVTEQKRQAQKLRIRERAIESSSHGVLIADACQPDHPIIYVNAAFQDITGYSDAEVLGLNCRFLQGNDRDQPILRELRLAIREKRGGTFRLRNYKKDGTPFWNEMTLAPVPDDSGVVTHFVAILNDITRRVEAEETLERYNNRLQTCVEQQTAELRETLQELTDKIEQCKTTEALLVESESMLRLVTDQAPAVLWATDAELQITLCAGGALEHLGLKPAELVGQSLYDYLQTDAESPIVKAHLAALQGDSQYYDVAHGGRSLECRLEPIKNDHGDIAGCVGIAWDITERLALEATVQESEQRLRLVMDAVPALIGYVDKDERFRYMNAEFERAFQRGRDKMVGKTVAEVLGPTAYELRRPHIAQVLAGETSVSETEMSLAGETPRLYQVTYVPQSNESRDVEGFFVLVVDLTQRIEAERNLRESEEQFRAIVENSHELIAMHNDERMLYLNRAGCDILGLAPEVDLSDPSILALFQTAIWQSNGLAKSRPASESTTPTPQKVINQSLQRPDGESIFVEGKGTTIFLQGNPVRVTLIRDITRRRAAEAALAESERVAQESLAELEHLHRNAPIGMCFVDNSMRYVRINEFLARINGTPAEEHIGRTVREILPQLGPEIEAQYHRILETGERSKKEVRGVTPADPTHIKYWLVDDHPVYDGERNIIGVQSTVLDITDRKLAEERFRLAVESAPNAMVMIDRRGQITLVNSETERCFGYDRSELIGAPVEILVPDRFRSNHPASRLAYYLDPKIRSMGAGRELFGRRKDGREFPVEIGLNPIEAPEGLFVLASVIDISHRKATEIQLAQHEQSLAHMGRVHLVGEMTSGIAHEINQPLVAVSLQSEICLKLIEQESQSVDLPDLRSRLLQIADQAKRAGNILHFLRRFVRGRSSSRSTRRIEEVIQQILDRMDAQARDANVEMLFARIDPLPVVVVDQIQIEQVLLNLIRNAFDALRGNDIGDRQVEIAVTKLESGELEVRVADNACHADAVELNRVFDSFYTTKTDGMGLGLAICRTIIESHGGRLLATRNKVRGLTFHFTLPTTSP